MQASARTANLDLSVCIGAELDCDGLGGPQERRGGMCDVVMSFISYYPSLEHNQRLSPYIRSLYITAFKYI